MAGGGGGNRRGDGGNIGRGILRLRGGGCAVNYNNFFLSLLWGSFRFIEKARSRANNDINYFTFMFFC